MPHFEYYLETLEQSVRPAQPLWRLPLPMSREDRPAQSPAGADSIRLGDYFQAVQAFIEGPAQSALIEDLARRGVGAALPEVFHIFLAKHGEFYHPARLATAAGGLCCQWVVNVAASPAGRAVIEREYGMLKRLGREFQPSYVPQVHAFSQLSTGDGNRLPMFLADWFSGYHEFHLSRKAPDSESALRLWDLEGGNRFLDTAQARELYRRAARILTHYLNLSTWEAIGAWHHAAGDFVAKIDGSEVEVRLVTVRQYRPLFRIAASSDRKPADIKTLLESLLLFLLQVSIRMRLDRLEGVGDFAWAGAAAVEGTLSGVIEALAGKTREAGPPLGLLLSRYLQACSAEDLLDLCRGIVSATFEPRSPELGLVQEHLAEHCGTLAEAIQGLP